MSKATVVGGAALLAAGFVAGWLVRGAREDRGDVGPPNPENANHSAEIRVGRHAAADATTDEFVRLRRALEDAVAERDAVRKAAAARTATPAVSAPTPSATSTRTVPSTSVRDQMEAEGLLKDGIGGFLMSTTRARPKTAECWILVASEKRFGGLLARHDSGRVIDGPSYDF